jgi:hypothetical protein
MSDQGSWVLRHMPQAWYCEVGEEPHLVQQGGYGATCLYNEMRVWCHMPGTGRKVWSNMLVTVRRVLSHMSGTKRGGCGARCLVQEERCGATCLLQ